MATTDWRPRPTIHPPTAASIRGGTASFSSHAAATTAFGLGRTSVACTEAVGALLA